MRTAVRPHPARKHHTARPEQKTSETVCAPAWNIPRIFLYDAEIRCCPVEPWRFEIARTTTDNPMMATPLPIS